MDKRFLIILIVMVLGLGGLFFLSHDKAAAPGASSNSSSVSNHSKGENSKNVELMVYGDFQCPACGQIYPIEKQVVTTFNDQIKFTFRHFPLESIHPNARAASRAAEAAGLQGKFFEMHDALYESQTTWSSLSNPLSEFTTMAQKLGLDIEKFKTDYASETVNATINADLKEGNSKNVSGTPSYFINGKKVDNSDINTYEKFSAVIQKAINGQ